MAAYVIAWICGDLGCIGGKYRWECLNVCLFVMHKYYLACNSNNLAFSSFSNFFQCISRTHLNNRESQIMIQIIRATGERVFPYKIVFVVLIWLKYALEQYVNCRQVKRYMVKKMPPEVARFRITQDQFSRSQHYSFDKLTFEMFAISLKVALDTIFILGNIMPMIWDNVSSIFFFIDPDSQFQRGLAFIIIEYLKVEFFDVPIHIYQTLVIEKRYEQTRKTFELLFFDLFVETALGLIILPPILYIYLWIVEVGGDNFYWGVEILIVSTVLLLSWLHPNFISPLFDEFKQLEHSSLRDSILQLAQKVNFPLRQIYVMSESKRSSHSNAYFYGFGSNKRIVLYDTLISRLSQDEVVSVVGHELGHWKHMHALYRLVLYVVQVLCMFFLFSFFRHNEEFFISFGFREKSTFVATMLFFAMFNPIRSVFDLLDLVLSRYFEFQADQFACQQGLGAHLFGGLRKLYRQNATCMTPDKAYSWMRHSHPTIHERIQRIRQADPQIVSSKSQSVRSSQQNSVSASCSYSHSHSYSHRSHASHEHSH